MPKICPQCKEQYDEKIYGKKVTIPENGRLCHHDSQYEGDVNTGIWYVHE